MNWLRERVKKWLGYREDYASLGQFDVLLAVVQDMQKEIGALKEQIEKLSEPRIAEPTDMSVERARLPWHIRRKELEAAHKTKRKQLEEYREMA